MMFQVNLFIVKVLFKEVLYIFNSVNVIVCKVNFLKVFNDYFFDKKFFLGNKMVGEDIKIFQYFWIVYIIDIDSIIRFMNRVIDVKKKDIIVDMVKILIDLGLVKVDNVIGLNEFLKLLDKS